ncbi:hypothetical protein B0H13DRAFT_2267969 [Mycena leptocephala]|nr:hypothetical protein B0H13DRAFT_2267969 [Mycena leptocephala]
MPRKPGMNVAMPHGQYTPELEYTLNLGAESTPVTPRLDNVDMGVDMGVSAPVPPRTRSWRPAGHEGEQKARSSAYDAAGNLKVAVRGRRAAARDCGICEEVAVNPVRTQCCGALFCREHIDDWLYAPAATGLCPACSAPCVLPPSRGTSASPSSSPARARAHARPRTPPSSRSTSPHRNSSLDTSCPPSALDLDDGVLLPSLSSTKGAQFGLKPEESSTTIAARSDSTKPQMKYPRPGADALVRLLAGFVAFILLLGALSRRGGESGVELGGEL